MLGRLGRFGVCLNRRTLDLEEFFQADHAEHVFFQRRPIGGWLCVGAEAVGQIGVNLLPGGIAGAIDPIS